MSDQMIKSDKKLKNLALLLEKDDPLVISQAIELLREEEPFEGALALLASYYDNTGSTVVTRAIESFMNDIRDKSVQDELMAEIRKERNPRTTAMLVSSCWQSGMDYTSFAYEIAGLFLRSDLVTAVECFTLLEGLITELDDNQKTGILRLLENSEADSGTRKSLKEDLLSMLRE
jgi:predicted DNA-binding protein